MSADPSLKGRKRVFNRINKGQAHARQRKRALRAGGPHKPHPNLPIDPEQAWRAEHSGWLSFRY